MLQVSRRAQTVIASPIRKLFPLVSAAEARGVKVYKLNVGDPEIEMPRQLLAAIRRYPYRHLRYAPSPGIPEHVAAWVRYYASFGVRVRPEQIVPTIGCAEAILLTLLAVADPGDEVIVFEPVYSSYRGFAAMAAVKLVPVTLRVEDNFALPPDRALRAKLTRRTRAVVVVNPSNPTGTVLTAAERERLVRFARRHRLFLIADETYREIVFSGRPSSFLRYRTAAAHVVVVDSTSKRFSCPGARIGCVVSRNADVMWAVLKYAMARLSAPTLEQYALIPLLQRPTAYTRRVTAEYRRRRDVVVSALRSIPGVVCPPPDGAFYVIVRLPVADAEDFVRFLIRDFRWRNRTVIVTPARDFYVTPNLGVNEVRLAYVLPPRQLEQAMAVFRAGLAAYQRRRQG